MESIVLLRVKYLEQRRRRVAVHCIAGNLVYLVQDEDRV